ncbi:MAG: lipopolysaccharide/colanic/teichoic acid biosynthesis glycosyltransferase [Myxococcota bacterium]|jgi:lipopolysaccharide/colanic/teichoic acid biosynthesis glycosyltransferase
MIEPQRIIELTLMSGGLIVFAPVMGILAACIVLEDGGSIFFRQARVGLGGVPFSILKLRSMRDGEVTSTGRWIRATGLDEVAQFLNVLRGEMSLVGPRPLTAEDLERLGWSGPTFSWRTTVRPGITGMAQIFGRGARESAALDRGYVEGRDLWLDVELVGVSFAMNVCGKSRVRRILGSRRSGLLRSVRLARRSCGGAESAAGGLSG